MQRGGKVLPFCLNNRLAKHDIFVKKFYHVRTSKDFNDYRQRMNDVILSKNNLVMKRLWNLDTNTYEEGALDTRTKEMLGLVASMVLVATIVLNTI